jgi:hypothetical protein
MPSESQGKQDLSRAPFENSPLVAWHSGRQNSTGHETSFRVIAYTGRFVEGVFGRKATSRPATTKRRVAQRFESVSSAIGLATLVNLSINASNRIMTAGFNYDLVENLTANVTSSYAWNAESEIKTANSVNYTYDGDGNRVQKSNGRASRQLSGNPTCRAAAAWRKNPGPAPVPLTSQPAAASADVPAGATVAVPADLAVISSPFLFISNLCFRSKPLTKSRAALPTAPGRLDASTLTVDSIVSSFRSR